MVITNNLRLTTASTGEARQVSIKNGRVRFVVSSFVDDRLDDREV